MAPQSQAPQVLLTRPLAQSRRFARALRAAWGGPLQITISPLMQPTFLQSPLPEGPFAGLIFSSETGVAAFLRLPRQPFGPAWCVGKQTLAAAKKAGLETVLAAKDAASLLSAIITARPEGHLLHLRGEDSVGDIAATLTSAGIPTAEAILYAQRPVALTATARRLLQKPAPVIVPLFSPRSARLFLAAAAPVAPLRIAALSPAVVDNLAFGPKAIIATASSPDAGAMIETVISLLTAPASA